MIIYQTTNLINNKKYIGKDKNNNPNYLGSGTYIKKAIKKYGKENFKKEILEYCDNKQHLIEREEYWLKFHDVENNKLFYNQTNKAFGNSGLSQETKEKISKAKKGHKYPKEHGEKISKSRIGLKILNFKKGEEHGNFNKLKTEEHKKNISKSKTGHKCYNEEWKNNIKKNRQKCIESKIKPIQQMDKNNKIIKEYSSITEARMITGIKGIKDAVTGRIKTSGGYYWKYKN